MSPKDKLPGTDTKAQKKARKAYDETVYRAFKAYFNTKEQADIAHEKALKQAIDKRAKEKSDIKYKDTLEQARKVRDGIMDEAKELFSNISDKQGE